MGPLEICQTEELHASCAPGQVVIMRSAAYGRMRIGQCVATDYGYVGCHVNVTSVLEKRCSGRRECWVRVPDAELDDLSECPPEFKTYLEVIYDCFPGRGADTALANKYLNSFEYDWSVSGVWSYVRSPRCRTFSSPWDIFPTMFHL